MHPNFDDKINMELLNIKNIHLFSGKDWPEIMDYLNCFDALITDYSSIYFDYLLLDRPIIFLPYDYEQYSRDTGFTVPYDDFTPGHKPSTMKEFMSAIQESFDTDRYKTERQRVSRICNRFQKNNCEELVRLLHEKNILS
jgi:CDP-glycerol glycerophosphotransferase